MEIPSEKSTSEIMLEAHLGHSIEEAIREAFNEAKSRNIDFEKTLEIMKTVLGSFANPNEEVASDLKTIYDSQKVEKGSEE